ncbi:MAG TPA: hypothetical protein VES73_03540 [Lamprocystis sp. (in: g-proteobacteria)]|nr:hypothetical protein [Lamprocystis sp. (in: g-proteobacteria)]
MVAVKPLDPVEWEGVNRIAEAITVIVTFGVQGIGNPVIIQVGTSA